MSSISGLSAIMSGGIGGMAKMNEARIDKTSKDFEAMFIGQMVGQMFDESVGSEAFGGEDSSDVYKGMMTDAYGKEIAKAGGIGIADYVKRELIKLQEA